MASPLTDSIEIRLAATLEAMRPAIADFCSRLIQTPSVNGVHDEIALAEVIAAEAQRLGLHTQIVGDQPRRPNVIVSTQPQGTTGLLLLGHLDTVPPGDGWQYPPFSGKIADGRVHGRGAIDTKGGMAASLYTLAALQRCDALPAGYRAQFIGVPDEETGATGTLGIKYLTAHGLLNAKGAIYAYSGHEIILGHRGLLRYRLICEGQAIHTGAFEWQEGSAGANAVTGMARLLLGLEGLEFPQSTAPYFERFRPIITPGTVINGGVNINIVPDHCEALVDCRTTPEADSATIEALMEQFMGRISDAYPGLRFSYERLNNIPAAISDENAPLFGILEDVIPLVKGVPGHKAVAGPANEGYLLIAHGIPTVCGLGPDGENAHALNEYVEIQGLVDAALIYALTARRLTLT